MEMLNDERMNTPLDDSDELYHWGIKGMKWGVRRYQTKDGSLTPAGLKRYNKDMEKLQKQERRLANERATKAKLDKLDNAKKRIEEQKAELKKKPGDEEKPKQKAVSEMTNEEVAAYKQRMQNERDILKFKSEISAMTPKEKSKIEKFSEGIGGTLVKKAWDDVAKGQINKFLEKNLGIEKPLDELGKLKKEADIWKQKENISKSKNTIWNNDKNQREYSENKAKKEAEKAAKEAKEAKAKEAQEAKKQREMDAYEEFQRKERESRENPPKRDTDSIYRMKGDEIKDRVWTSNKPDKQPLLLTGPIKKGEDFANTLFNSMSNDTYRDTRRDGNNYYRSPKKTQKSTIEMTKAVDDGEIWVMNMSRNNAFNSTWVDYDDIDHSAMNLDNESYDALMHYGIKAMKWGVNRFYNKDGSRTAAGKKRENDAKRDKRSSDNSDGEKTSSTSKKKAKFSSEEEINDVFKKKFTDLSKKESDTRKESDKAYEEYRKTGEQKYAELGKKLSEEASKLDLELDNMEDDWKYELDKFYSNNKN